MCAVNETLQSLVNLIRESVSFVKGFSNQKQCKTHQVTADDEITDALSAQDLYRTKVQLKRLILLLTLIIIIRK